MPNTSEKWPCAAAMSVEGLVWLCGLLPRLAALWLFLWPPTPFVRLFPNRLVLSAIGEATLIFLLYAPAHIGRTLWYAALSVLPIGDWPPLRRFFQGWKHLPAAIRWQGRLWLRKALCLSLAALPPLLVLQLGNSAVEQQGHALALLWLLCAGGLGLVTGGGGVLWLCRYAAAPLLIGEGVPGDEALRRSARLIRGHRREYINFLGDWLPALFSCLLVVPVFWQLPRFHRAKAAFLLRLCHPAAKTVCFPSPAPANRRRQQRPLPQKP